MGGERGFCLCRVDKGRQKKCKVLLCASCVWPAHAHVSERQTKVLGRGATPEIKAPEALKEVYKKGNRVERGGSRRPEGLTQTPHATLLAGWLVGTIFYGLQYST